MVKADMSKTQYWSTFYSSGNGANPNLNKTTTNMVPVEQTVTPQKDTKYEDQKKTRQAIVNGLSVGIALSSIGVALSPLVAVAAASDTKVEIKEPETIKEEASNTAKSLKDAISDYEKTGDFEKLEAAYKSASELYSTNEASITTCEKEAQSLRDAAETGYTEAKEKSEAADTALSDYENGDYKKAQENLEAAKKGQPALDEAYEKAVSARETAKTNLDNAETSLKNTQASLTQVNNQLNNIDALIRALQGESPSLKGEALDKANADLSKLVKDRKELLKSREKLIETRDNAVKKRDELKATYEQAISDENKAKEAKEKGADVFIKQAEEELGKAREHLDELKHNAAEAKEAMEIAAEDKKIANDKAKEFDKQAAALRKGNKTLKTQIDRADSAMAERNMSIKLDKPKTEETKTQKSVKEAEDIARAAQAEHGPTREVQELWEEARLLRLEVAKESKDPKKIAEAEQMLETFYQGNSGYAKSKGIIPGATTSKTADTSAKTAAQLKAEAKAAQAEQGPTRKVQEMWELGYLKEIEEAKETKDQAKINAAEAKLKEFYKNNSGYARSKGITV